MPKSRSKKRTVSVEIDRHLGARLRELRLIRGLSQSQLAHVADIAFQQLQKYEKGTNRLSGSTLYLFAEHLGVPVSFFFDGLEREAQVPAIETSRMTLEAARALAGVQGELREVLISLARSISRA